MEVELASFFAYPLVVLMLVTIIMRCLLFSIIGYSFV
uniref:Uncharacterized protein n=1 Tax=Arundo donax TaxID=35708 RepID=A0A0A9AR69_ARUDO